MYKLLKWLFIESTAKWIWIIMTLELIVALTLSPTILTDYPILNKVVDGLSFIPFIHNFDELTINPQAVQFYIAMVTITLIPKAICMYIHSLSLPITFIRAYVITPYTMTKPKSTRAHYINTLKQEHLANDLEQVPRSMFSRIFWSLMILSMSTLWVWAYQFGVEGEPLKMTSGQLNSGLSLWCEFAVNGLLSAILIAISIHIIRDYIRLFGSILNRFSQILK